MDERYDVVIVGGGAAGLSAALALGRARRAVLVVDAGEPRNAPAAHVHNYLGREGTPPGELLAIGRAEVAGYGVEVVDGTVASAEALDGADLQVRLAEPASGRTHRGPAAGAADPGHDPMDGWGADRDGATRRHDLTGGRSVAARRLLVTSGLVDVLPDVPGVAERWGRDVLHCPYCHGWEVRDQALGVLASGPMSFHQALLFRQWSADVTLFLHDQPEPGDEEREQFAARGIAVVPGEVAGLEVAGDRITGVRLRSGEIVARQAVVVAPRFHSRAEVLRSLGLESVAQEVNGYVYGSAVPADPSGATAVPGVWVAGNVTDLRAHVISSAAAGLNAAAAINTDLIAEDTRMAVAAHRTRVATEVWDARYSQSERIWSGRPNGVLVDEVTDLTPGTALDLGSGEGADAIWLAGQGWRVTGVDISQVALDRAAAHAAEAGVTDRIDWQRHDLAVSFPSGSFDLVSAHFLHSLVALPREEILRRAAAAVAPGGVLLVVGHAGPPSWDPHPEPGSPHAAHLPTPEEVLDALDLPDGEWEVLRSDEHERAMTGPDGQPATRPDNALMLRRLPAQVRA